MGRLAAILVLLSQAALLWLVFEPSGKTAIVFAFVGHPLLASGVLLALYALLSRLRRERAEARAAAEPSAE